MRRRRHRVGGDVIVRVTQIVRREEDDERINCQHGTREPAVLGSVERMERKRVLFRLHIDAGRVVRPRDVQRPDVQDGDARNHERQQIMEREEARQRCLVRRKAAEQPDAQRLADDREGREEAGDDLCTPIAHLTPRQDIAHEGRRHHQQVDHQAEHPDQFARRLVGAEEQTAENVDVDDNEEEACAIGVGVSQEPASVDVAHDMFDRTESPVGRCIIMHRQHDPGNDLDHQEQAGENAEVPEIIQVARNRVTAADRAINQARDRQSVVEPLAQFGFRFVGLGPRKAHLMPLSRSSRQCRT